MSVKSLSDAYLVEDDAKKADLVDHLFMLLITLEATEKSIVADIVLNEDQMLQAESLKCDINDALECIYKKDPRLAFDISHGHDLLGEFIERLDKVK